MFTDLVKNLADKNNVQISKMLKDLNLADGSFNNWKNRNTVPSGTIVAKIAQYFNVSADYLLGLTDEPRPEYSPNDSKNVAITALLNDEGISLYIKLDEVDRAEIRGEMKVMLRAEKYSGAASIIETYSAAHGGQTDATPITAEESIEAERLAKEIEKNQ